MTGTVAAFFDVDGTLTRTDIFRDHLRFRSETRPGPRTTAWLLSSPLRAAWVLLLDRWDRRHSNRAVYRCYRGFRPEELRAWGRRLHELEGLGRTHAVALERLRRHARQGHRIVLVTGSLAEVIEPLARSLEDALGLTDAIRVEAVRLDVDGDRFTGAIRGEPLSGGEKARRARAVAEEEGLDLGSSHAYGDSLADVELLEAVGNPCVVNPEARLRRLARRRGWPVLEVEAAAVEEDLP